jgi:hypothetical protein
MIRCVRAKSSMGYPEVFHRFCGYLGGAEKIFRIFYCDESYALSSGSRLNFAPASKKFRVLGTESSICNRTQIFWAVGRPLRRRILRPRHLRIPAQQASARLRTCCCAHSAAAKIRGENAVAREHQLESPPVGPVAQWLVQGTHRVAVPSRRKPRSGRDEFREPFRSCCAGMRECRGRRMRERRDRWQP